MECTLKIRLTADGLRAVGAVAADYANAVGRPVDVGEGLADFLNHGRPRQREVVQPLVQPWPGPSLAVASSSDDPQANTTGQSGPSVPSDRGQVADGSSVACQVPRGEVRWSRGNASSTPTGTA